MDNAIKVMRKNMFIKEMDKTQPVKMLEILSDGRFHGNLEISKYMGSGEPCRLCGEKKGVALRLTSVTDSLRRHGVEIKSNQVKGAYWEYRLINLNDIYFTTKGFKIKKQQQLNLED